MPSPTAPLPTFLPPLHIYRHLLRECTYLPPAWSNPIVSLIRERFHQNRKHDPRQEKHRAQAFQLLNSLRAANAGDKAVMQRLMRKGFGRKGPRRRAIVSKFVLQQGPSDSDALEALVSESIAEPTSTTSDFEPTSKPSRKATKAAFHLKWDKEKLHKFFDSQGNEARKCSDYWVTNPIKSNNEDRYVRLTTIWGTPVPQSNIVKRQGKFWQQQSSRMMPPLEKDEWELIGRLGNGAQEYDKDYVVAHRRTPAKLIRDDPDAGGLGWDWEGYARYGANEVESRRAEKRSRRVGQKGPGPYAKPINAREIKPRWYRRAYERIGKITPMIEQDAHSLKHVITWGQIAARAVPAIKSQLDMFEGESFSLSQIDKKRARKKHQTDTWKTDAQE